MPFGSKIKKVLISDQGNLFTTFGYGLVVGAIVKYYSLTARFAFRKETPHQRRFQ